jgi:hypothetical protein
MDMRTLQKLALRLGCALAIPCLFTLGLFAQSNPPPPGPPPPRFGRGGPGGPDGIGFLGFQAGFNNKVVTGAPYSAQVTSEHVETLGDGNQIDQKNTITVYRDGQGRTRREETLAAIGSYSAQGTPPQAIFINDPVGGVSYVLDPVHKTGRKFALPQGHKGPNNNQQFQRGNPNGTGVSLGTQTMEGLLVQGTQYTRTIPAGRMGNAQPIQIVTTRWFSSQLNIDVQTQTTDPMHGKTTTNVANISTTEPDATLFQLPSDYTLQQGNVRGRRPGAGNGAATPPPPPQ